MLMKDARLRVMANEIHNLSRGIIVRNNYLLVCKSERGNFVYLPGGHIEYHETAQEALVRELEEETGMTSFIITNYLGCIEYIFNSPSKCHDHEYNFIFRVDSMLKVEDGSIRHENNLEMIWISLDNLKDIDLRPYCFKELMSKWLQNENVGYLAVREL